MTNGAETAEFALHKALLCEKSPYFRALPNFTEGINNEVELKEMCPKAFRYILHWVYRESFPTAGGALMIRAYTIADRLMMAYCKNLLMDQLRAYFRDKYPGPNTLRLIGELGYGESSKIGQYVKEQLVHDWGYKGFRESCPDMLKTLWDMRSEFAYEVSKAVLSRFSDDRDYARNHGGKINGSLDPSARPGCQYHEHMEGEICYTSKS